MPLFQSLDKAKKALTKWTKKSDKLKKSLIKAQAAFDKNTVELEKAKQDLEVSPLVSQQDLWPVTMY